MIYVIYVIFGAAIFSSGAILGALASAGTKKAKPQQKFKGCGKGHSEQTAHIRNFLDYDGTPQP